MKKQKLVIALHQCDGNIVDCIGFKEYEIQDNKISKELVDNFIDKIEFKTINLFGKPTTLMNYKLKNGFTGSESTTSVDPSNYSLEIGSDILKKRLEEKIYFGLGFALGMAQEKSE